MENQAEQKGVFQRSPQEICPDISGHKQGNQTVKTERCVGDNWLGCAPELCLQFVSFTGVLLTSDRKKVF